MSRRVGLIDTTLRDGSQSLWATRMTTAMMVSLGEDGVKTMEDFAGYAVDDLVGWKERKDGETKHFPGVLADHDVSRAEAEQMVLAARLKAGWISPDEAEEDESAAAESAGA